MVDENLSYSSSEVFLQKAQDGSFTMETDVQPIKSLLTNIVKKNFFIWS